MENKLEYWRNQTLVNRTSTNNMVAVIPEQEMQ